MSQNLTAFRDTIAWSEIGPALLAESDNGYNVIEVTATMFGLNRSKYGPRASAVYDVGRHEPALSQSKPQGVPALRGSRNRSLRSLAIFRELCVGHGVPARRHDAGQNRQQRSLQPGQLPVGHAVSATHEHATPNRQRQRPEGRLLVRANQSLDGLHKPPEQTVRPRLLHGFFRGVLRAQISGVGLGYWGLRRIGAESTRYPAERGEF